jgi:hypothetical protein
MIGDKEENPSEWAAGALSKFILIVCNHSILMSILLIPQLINSMDTTISLQTTPHSDSF